MYEVASGADKTPVLITLDVDTYTATELIAEIQEKLTHSSVTKKTSQNLIATKKGAEKASKKSKINLPRENQAFEL